jgi:hypothetical protein
MGTLVTFLAGSERLFYRLSTATINAFKQVTNVTNSYLAYGRVLSLATTNALMVNYSFFLVFYGQKFIIYRCTRRANAES